MAEKQQDLGKGIPEDILDTVNEIRDLKERLGIDPWDGVRKQLQENKEQLKAMLEEKKPAKP